MPSVDLTPYYQPQGSTSDGTKFDNLLALLQSTLNGLDQNNFAAGKIFDPTKIQQGGAVDGQGLIWDGTGLNWTPAGTVKRLADSVLSGAAATFDFTGIPATFAHLMVVVEGRSDAVATSVQLLARFNNDSAANYDWVRQDSTEAGVVSGNGAGGSNAIVLTDRFPAASAAAGQGGHYEGRVSQYAGTTGGLRKIVSGTYFGADGTHIYSGTGSGDWRTVNTAINRLTLLLGSGNFITGSRATLYGLG